MVKHDILRPSNQSAGIATGMALNLDPLPAWTALDERRARRRSLDVAASMATPVCPAVVGVRIADISTHGCQLVVPGGAATGRYVTVALPSSLAVEGWIAWSKDDRAGVDFAHPMPGPLLDWIVASHV